MIYDALKRLKAGTSAESNGRHIIPGLATKACSDIEAPRILDVGAGKGAELLNIGKVFHDRSQMAHLHAIESFPLSVAMLRERGIAVSPANLERDRFGFDDAYFDVVICNQVFEHLKEIFWLASEIARVLKPGGTAIIGVPNLGSLHNRLSLLFGAQPPAIHVLGPHVRGFTEPGMKRFLETGGVFKVRSVLGGNFYPFPPSISRPLSRILPSLAVVSFYVVTRTESRKSFLDLFDTDIAGQLVDTPYYRGERQQVPA